MKILIICSNQNLKEVMNIKKQLEFMGYEVILPNSYNELDEEQINTNVLVLNFDKNINNNLLEVLIKLNKLGYKICLYNDVIDQEKIKNMDPIILNGDLFKIEDGYKQFEKNNLLKYMSLFSLKYAYSRDILYLRACSIIDNVFKDKVDKAGERYLNHLYRVSNRLDDITEKIAGLLHDIVEDTEVTYYDLLEMGFPIDIIEIISLVTNKKIDKTNMTKEEKLDLYNQKIDSIINSGNIHALRVKEADMSDNYDEDRLKELPSEMQEWFSEKYGKQLIKLREAKKRGI